MESTPVRYDLETGRREQISRVERASDIEIEGRPNRGGYFGKKKKLTRDTWPDKRLPTSGTQLRVLPTAPVSH